MDKHPLQQAIEDAGFECREYSGRGMYGKQCLAVDIDRGSSIGDMVAGILESRDGDEDDTAEIADGFRSLQSDAMGLGIIYYFPVVPYVSEEEEADADEDLEFNVKDYESSHGGRPHGEGSWAFSLKNPSRRDWTIDDVIFVPSMPFKNAKREFARVARMFGVVGTVYVCS